MSPEIGIDTHTQTQSKFAHCVSALTAGENHRVWSLIVTFFGDLALSKGDRVSGALLTEFGNRAGIKPEAMRVALHRLRRGDWIASERNGRRSVYFLTPRGRKESVAASPKIYSNKSVTADGWSLIISASGTRLDALTTNSASAMYDWVPVDERLAIAPDTAVVSNDTALHLPITAAVPDWLQRRLIDGELNQACDRLVSVMSKFHQHCPDTKELDAIEIVTLRTLVVHSWRKVRLRQPELPDCFFPGNWNGSTCRLLVNQALQKLPKPELSDLDSHLFDTMETAAI